MRPLDDRQRCVGRLDIPQPPEAARSQAAGIPWRLRNAVCRGFLGKYGYVTLFRGASRCELESAVRCLFGNIPYPFDPPGEGIRSEEHTSELKSQMPSSYAVFCL